MQKAEPKWEETGSLKMLWSDYIKPTLKPPLNFWLQVCASTLWFRPAVVDLGRFVIYPNFHARYSPDTLNIHTGTSPPMMAAIGCLISYAHGNSNPHLNWYKKINKSNVSSAQVLWNKITSYNNQKKGNHNGEWLHKSWHMHSMDHYTVINNSLYEWEHGKCKHYKWIKTRYKIMC